MFLIKIYIAGIKMPTLSAPENKMTNSVSFIEVTEGIIMTLKLELNRRMIKQ